jgi:hypothetical protein
MISFNIDPFPDKFANGGKVQDPSIYLKWVIFKALTPMTQNVGTHRFVKKRLNGILSTYKLVTLYKLEFVSSNELHITFFF